MKCQKIKYDSKVDALTHLNILLKNDIWRKKDRKGKYNGRVYSCPECKKWHITSKTKGGSLGVEFREVGLFYEDKWVQLLNNK